VTALDFDPRLAAITLLAATINGAIGYGFSSITVPIALLFLTNRLLNPALVLIEVVANGYSLVVNRRGLPAAWPVVRRVAPGLPIGIAAGTTALARVDPGWMKLLTFAALLPVILLQGTGWRRPIRSLHAVGPAIGAGVGSLYAVTTISGPPLAVMLTNQGLARGEFRAGMAALRLVESTLAAAAYAWAGLFTAESLDLIPSILPGLAFGLPFGAWAIRRVPAEIFRRLCISLDAWLVAFGLAMLLRTLAGVAGPTSYAMLAVVIAIDGVLFWRFATSGARRSPDARAGTGAAPG
jgi:hypothetical protein